MSSHGNVLGVLNLEQLEEEAPTRADLPRMAFDYYASGADSECSVKDNRESYARFKVIPRVLVDVSKVDTKQRIFGTDLAFPVLVAPMAMQQMAHPEGELAVARACHATGNAMIVSTGANYGVSDVAAAAGADHLWFQLYVFKTETARGVCRDRDIVRVLVQDAEQAGYRALVVTVDAPFMGNREADVKNSFRLPENMTLANAARVAEMVRRPTTDGSARGSGIAEFFSKQIDESLTWDFILFLKSISRLPVLVKGVLSPADAELAVRAGADGVIVSNHGGRQLDTAVAPIDVVASISAAVRGRIRVLLDGSIRRGTDVLKALALGADAVLLGRPVLYALARGGQAGVEQALRILQREFELAMALAGCQSINAIGAQLVVHSSQLPLRSSL